MITFRWIDFRPGSLFPGNVFSFCSNPCILLPAVFKKLLAAVLLLLLLLAAGCDNTPIVQVRERQYPQFTDDLHHDSLKAALEKSIVHLRALPPDKKFTIASRSYSALDIIDSHLFFLKLVDESEDPETLNRKIRQHFHLYQAQGVSGFNPARKMLVTGYYLPVFKGSLEADEEYRFPLYGIPDDLVVKRGGEGITHGKNENIGRLEKGRFLPYWTRGEIETGNLLTGQEMVWLKDPLDVFGLHIQGSGLLSLEDGTLRGVHYRLRNGRKYRSIGKYMVDQQMLTLEQVNMDSIRSYLQENPHLRDEILHHNESFIFFEWIETHGAIGSLGQELTPERSIAADQKIFPPGSLGFLVTRVPVVKDNRVVNWKQVHRFVTVQDSGAAIKGPGRVDLFWGRGAGAGRAAGRMKEDGTLFILMRKGD